MTVVLPNVLGATACVIREVILKYLYRVLRFEADGHDCGRHMWRHSVASLPVIGWQTG
jgi:hypothetical protein